jgi:hypothetical protein
MHAALALALLLLAAPVADKPPMAITMRVRTTTAAAPLLARAARSATVQSLLARLAATDVIVYIEMTPSPAIPLARTKLVTATPSARFLRIGINSAVPLTEMPVLIAHELQHALEIAEREEVRSDEDVRRLYTRIGHHHGVDSYETDAARDVERLVRNELR